MGVDSTLPALTDLLLAGCLVGSLDTRALSWVMFFLRPSRRASPGAVFGRVSRDFIITGPAFVLAALFRAGFRIGGFFLGSADPLPPDLVNGNETTTSSLLRFTVELVVSIAGITNASDF